MKTTQAKPVEVRDAQTRTTTRTDPDDGFTRTAIVCEAGNTGSLDLVSPSGVRLAQINISTSRDGDGKEWLIVDVIDVDDRYTRRKAFCFSRSGREEMDVPEGGNLVSTDFRA